MGQHSRSIPVIATKDESLVKLKNTKNQQGNTTTTTTTDNITTTTTNNNSTNNNNNNFHNNNNTNSKTLTNSALKTTSSLPASTTTTTSISSSPSKLSKDNITHDPNYCMFKLQLDTEGNTAALCYLPTRFKNIVEFYHIEIPSAYRNLGLGDLLLCKAFEWAEKSKMMVIPSCPFVLQFLSTRYSNQNDKKWSCIVTNDKETQF